LRESGYFVNKKATRLHFMQQASNQNTATQAVPEARYAYYRRCQEFCKNGEQCKAPAEKRADVCYSHASQRAKAARREIERRAVLAMAVAEMRRRGKLEFEMADLFTSFNGIQVTIAAVAQALIENRIDCKTAGRLLWDLQRIAKLLRLYQRTKTQTTKDTKEHKGTSIYGESEQMNVGPKEVEVPLEALWAANEHERTKILKPEALMSPQNRGWPNDPWEWARAA
jgi:hypothetical protein